MYRILLTGFLPFGGESVNPSLEAVRSIQVEFPNVELIRLEVPTIFGEAERMVIEQVSFCRPHAVLCTGLASGRTDVSIERVAINVDDARIPDTAGQQPLDVPIQPHGPAAYFSTLPIKSIAQSILSAGVPVEISNTAGTYVCNHLMYQVLHYTTHRCPAVRAGFIHVPFGKEHLNGRNIPALPMKQITAALETAIYTLSSGGSEAKNTRWGKEV